MKITVQSSKVVTPSSSGCRPTADPEAVPLTAFDKVNYHLYVCGLYLFRPPAPSSSVLEAGLAAALAEYPEWAGRLGFDARGNHAILLNGSGAWFVDATADVPLHSVMPLEPATTDALSLHPSGEDDAVDDELLLVQVTRFACGSFVVGTAAHHLVGDGLALRSFMNAWGQATRGAAVDPVPVHDRVSFFVPRDPLRVDFQHRGAEYRQPRTETPAGSKNVVDDKLVMRRVNFSREFIAELQARASAGEPRRYSKLQCLAAHLWRCVTKARRLDGRTGTQLRVSVNGRARMRRPGLPQGYAGNAVLWARPATTAGELVRRPLGQVVALVSKAMAAMDDAYFRSFIDFASSGAVEEEGLVPTADPSETVLSPNLEVESLLGLPFQDLDFGGGPPFFYMPSYPQVEGVIFIVPSFSGDGSIDAYVPLLGQAMDVFTNCCHSLAAADARL